MASPAQDKAGWPASKTMTPLDLRFRTMPYLFFRKTLTPEPGAGGLARSFTLEFWRPGGLRLRPMGFPAMPFLVWGLCHRLRVFRSRDYAIVIIRQGGAVVHRTCLLPAHFRFPFMNPGDLQAAGIWTRPDRRGTGLGLAALQAVFQRLENPQRILWYMVREDNLPSVRLAKKAGFRLWGQGLKHTVLGIGLLGFFHITQGPNLLATRQPGPVRQVLSSTCSARRQGSQSPQD
jgi:RimJ/RimL family protein N-acetyltransferase